MALVVQKYGGSSLESADRIKRVAERIVATRQAGNDVVVAVSAMGDSTDELLDLAGQVSTVPPARELDMLLTAGERISMSLLAMAIHALGFEARSYTGSQAGVITTAVHGDARIIDVTPSRIQDAVTDGAIAIVAGFQGETLGGKEITTIGRGGTDTTAVALAAALKADVCEIYTDVDGVFSADPRIVRGARQLDQITYEEMLEMAACGSKVLHLRSVEYACRYGVAIRVRSSFNDKPGTLVTGWMEDLPVEHAVITGVAHDRSEAKVTVMAVPDHSGAAAQIFQVMAARNLNIDMVVQNASQLATGRTDITFTVPKADGPKAVAALERARPRIGFSQVVYDDHVGKVSLIGTGIRSHPGVTATFCDALSRAGVNIEIISTSEIRISTICRDTRLDDAVRALHDAFDLADKEEAVVYAGSGR